MAAPTSPILDPAICDRLCITRTRRDQGSPRSRTWLDTLSSFSDRAGFLLLILTVIALLMRPADLVPALAGVPLYQVCIGLCLIASTPRILSRPRTLRAGALLTLTVLFVPAIALSHLSHLDTWNAQVSGIEAAKACALFLLTLILTDKPADLRLLLLAIGGSVLVMTVLAILSYHAVLDIPALTLVVQKSLGDDGPALRRICGTGIFNDPNDYALVLVLCMSVCAFGAGDSALGRFRALAWAAFAVFGYALILTHSRGGLLSAVAAAGSYIIARFGWKNAIPLLVLLTIVMLAPVWGRQSDLNLGDPDDTFQGRLELWSSSLDVFRANPVLGLGQGKLADEIGQVTHNSFLHAFAELGLFGGILFLGVFVLAIQGLLKARPTDTQLARLRPCVLAITVGYAAGMLALSRCYTAPVQLILGIATAYLVLASRDAQPLIPRLNARCITILTAVGLLFLGASYLFIRVMIQRTA